VLIIDEIGYLEFEKNSGWNNSFKILREKEFKIAFIVVRIDLMGAALSYWEKAQILKIENGENVGLISNKILHQIEINATK
jgi:nucleoside-triphosphatase THEP1